ncbi:hypothetical protein GGE07_005834 [Sinorhizobium terangae]|nr:hypothetical protein [Sinorhizobium terangae]
MHIVQTCAAVLDSGYVHRLKRPAALRWLLSVGSSNDTEPGSRRGAH